MARAGLRISEVLAPDVSDVERIDKETGLVRFKSFEHGHLDESEDHYDEVAQYPGVSSSPG